MRVAFAADHAGAELKDELMARLAPLGHVQIDLGGDGSNSEDDYPDFARALGEAVLAGKADRGILICGSGVGASIAASKIPGIRAGLCHDTYSAGQGVEHDDMNVLTLGARVIGIETAVGCSEAFLAARFSGEPRHVRRMAKVRDIEANGPQIALEARAKDTPS
jgi:ribose 5-phosphate isomerase B